RATGGSTTRNTGEMHPMGTGKQRINSAVTVLLIVLAVELEHAQVVAELAHDPAAERELGAGVARRGLQVVAGPELELGPVAAEAAGAVRAVAEEKGTVNEGSENEIKIKNHDFLENFSGRFRDPYFLFVRPRRAGGATGQNGCGC